MSEVSTLPSSSYLSHTSGPSNTKPLASAADPAELLRQAALSSRKLKRRKLDASTSIASLSRPFSRPIASTPFISLDYGQEEPTSTISTSDRPPTPVMAQSSTPTQAFARRSPPRTLQSDSSSVAAPQTPLGDDTSAKEEGEISDSEDPPFRPPSKPVPPPIMGAVNATKVESSGVLRSPFVIASRSPSVKAEDAYQRATLPASATTPVGRYSIEAFPVELESETSSEGFRLETPLYVLDAHHVRPGLSLTQKQYDTSKEVILDILGYGVPPEYLIDCGLSREIIYYVFTELNLRLPNNLDVVGIPPYPPPQDVIASILLSQPSHSYSPSAIPSRSNVDGDTTQRSSLGAPGFSVQSTVSLEPIPHVVPPATTSASLDSSTSTSILTLSESTLAVMERQRKQELLARKAVQASRKRKEPPTVTQVLTSPTSTGSKGADASAKLPASAASVEDFLNSIGPPLSDTANSRGDLDAENSSGDMRASSPDPNSIDETIPGFGRTPSSDYELPEPLVDVTPAPLPPEALSLLRSASASEANFLVEREQDKTYPMMDNTSRVSENSPIPSRGDGVTIPQKTRDLGRDSQRSSSTPQSTAAIPRRGTKRPVAADFDSEPMPMAYTPSVLSRTGSGAGHSHVGAYHPNPHVRRKMNGVAAGGFASLSNSRRCVIDVSDSEDDASEEETPLVAIAPHVPQSQGASGSQPTARDTALALELEIERMRKMIREREEMKLRKQAMASSRLTAVSKEPTAVDVDVNVNVDVDVDIDVDIDTDVDVDKDERKRASEGQAQRTETESLHHPHPMVASASASASALSTFETTGVVEISRSETGSDKSSSENVLASSSAPSSSHRKREDVDVNGSSSISSTPSPPDLTPLSFEDNENDDNREQQVATPTTPTDQSVTVTVTTFTPTIPSAAVPGAGGGPDAYMTFNAESRQESAGSSRDSTPSHLTGSTHHRHPLADGPERTSVDVVASAQQVPTSSQIKADSTFIAYNSVLSHYPFLSGRSLGPQEMVDMPDLNRLKMQAAARRITQNSRESARICQFEVPGGGECRDVDCGDLHLSQLEVEPNDDETVQYLCGDQNVAQLLQALQAARARRPEATFDERVKEAWASMRDRRVQVTLDNKS